MSFPVGASLKSIFKAVKGNNTLLKQQVNHSVTMISVAQKVDNEKRMEKDETREEKKQVMEGGEESEVTQAEEVEAVGGRREHALALGQRARQTEAVGDDVSTLDFPDLPGKSRCFYMAYKRSSGQTKEKMER